MEFEDVSEEIEWEARRVAAAFGVETFECLRGPWGLKWSGLLGTMQVTWSLRDKVVSYIELGPEGWGIELMLEPLEPFESGLTEWWFRPAKWDTPEWNELAARGLYRLGFEAEETMFEVGVILSAFSAHKKLELRLSMPREFWPQKWLDEGR
ncbi:hypothetical protein EON83_23680 [bacterium]|nr:MAG: hypothetical protein EON83_23680 [bacterium]